MADVAHAPAPPVAEPPSDSQNDAAAQPEVSAVADDLADVTNRLSELMTKPAAECAAIAVLHSLHANRS